MERRGVASTLGLRDGASEARSPREIIAADGGGVGRTVISRGEQMDVVFHAADEEGRAIELFGDAAEIRMQRVTREFVAQEGPVVLGGEDQMNVNDGKGLWHVGRMPNWKRFASGNRRCESVFNPKWIVSISANTRAAI